MKGIPTVEQIKSIQYAFQAYGVQAIIEGDRLKMITDVSLDHITYIINGLSVEIPSLFTVIETPTPYDVTSLFRWSERQI